ncbi:amidohydrolase [Nocardioides sp. GXQ0305]|uniref:amidohydrolase n=1 Tax=Nocardioides sp. GXQ0305 TaxID=3423912 RepID=UPI003D7E9143
MPSPSSETSAIIDDVVDKHSDDLLELRRDLHAHPELSWNEHRTTEQVAAHLGEAGIPVTRIPGTGLLADIGDSGPLVGLRADLDALPVEDTSGVPWASTNPGVAHACGHDVHTAGLVGAGLALAELHARGQLPGRVRLLFQPAEEVMPGGALFLMDQGALDDMGRIFMLHCDPTLDVGQVGVRSGALTGAADALSVRLSGRGGHTSRPHLTEDLTYALGKLVTELPSVVSRRLDPRAGVSVVWGMVRAGAAHNVIPESGHAAGTIRMLDPLAWAEAEGLVRVLIDEIVAPYGVTADVDYRRGVPPVVNEHRSSELLASAVRRVVGAEGQVATTQSLGGEDFGWYLERVPGAMGRLGTRTPGGARYDLHQGNIVVDEAATPVAARVLAEVAVTSLSA